MNTHLATGCQIELVTIARLHEYALYSVLTKAATAGKVLGTAGAHGNAAGHWHASHPWHGPAAQGRMSGISR